jgi:hypothetical protein
MAKIIDKIKSLKFELCDDWNDVQYNVAYIIFGMFSLPEVITSLRRVLHCTNPTTGTPFLKIWTLIRRKYL